MTMAILAIVVVIVAFPPLSSVALILPGPYKYSIETKMNINFVLEYNTLFQYLCIIPPTLTSKTTSYSILTNTRAERV